LVKSFVYPTLAALGEDGLQVAFKQGAGVLQVLYGVGFGDGDAVKRCVENADDALLFGEWRKTVSELSSTPFGSALVALRLLYIHQVECSPDTAQ